MDQQHHGGAQAEDDEGHADCYQQTHSQAIHRMDPVVGLVVALHRLEELPWHCQTRYEMLSLPYPYTIMIAVMKVP